jgi:hypothetical protein
MGVDCSHRLDDDNSEDTRHVSPGCRWAAVRPDSVRAWDIRPNRAAMTEDEMVRRHLARLQDTATGIAAEAAQQGLMEEWDGVEAVGGGET